MRVLVASVILAVTFFLVGTPSSSAVYLTARFTGDNIVGAWYQNGGNPVLQDPPAGNHYTDWETADTATVQLSGYGHYQLIFKVENLATPLGEGNPAGFLADVGGPGVDGDLLTSVNWEWADADGDVPEDFDTLSWAAATSYGTNGDPNTIWYGVHGGAIAGISLDAHWIWNEVNGGGDETQSPLYFRGEFVVTPEPATLGILGVGLALLGIARLRRR